jgi:S-adenosylmethionine hydrolase
MSTALPTEAVLASKASSLSFGRAVTTQRPIVTLATDFGTSDGYAGAVKGILLARCPQAQIMDATHEIPRGDSRAAAFALTVYWRAYPPGTVHLVVVDPGVGTDRVPLALRVGEWWGVGPENGVFDLVTREADGVQAVALDPGSVALGPVSATFHGRDLFAPSAAALASGRSLTDLGEPHAYTPHLCFPEPLRVNGGLRGEVIHADRFGNLITNLRRGVLDALGPPQRLVVTCAGRTLPVCRTYGDVNSGALLALIDSSELLEIAQSSGSAAEVLGVGRGAPVEVKVRGG